MHNIEPYDRWKNLYDAAKDVYSPFYNRSYHDSLCTQTIYNYYIHPQWDYFGSDTLYCKILYADYTNKFTVIELMGEWNDCLYNDIMHFKRNVIDELLRCDINQFMIIGENVLNFHASDDCYYEEWYEDVEDGFIAFLNFRPHVLEEFYSINADYYFVSGGELDDFAWRPLSPVKLFEKVKTIVSHRLSY
jgi:hypothetical protein